MASNGAPLYVLAIGCVTNVASALLIEPEIARRIVVVWTSGYPTWVPARTSPHSTWFRTSAASRLLFESGVPLVYLPGYHIGAQLRLSLPDMEAYVRDQGAIGGISPLPLHPQPDPRPTRDPRPFSAAPG